MNDEEDRGGCDCSAAMNGATDHHPSCPMHVPKPVVAPRDEFADDYNRMIATVANFCDKHDVHKPDMVFHPSMLDRMRATSQQNIRGTLIFMGVRVRFGLWEQRDVLRSI